MDYAGFWRRFVAALIDGIILMAVMGVVFALIGVQAAPQSAASAQQVSATANGIAIVIGWLYFALMESNQPQGTVGKLALGLRVTDLDGGRIGFGRATGRHFAKFISAFIFMIGYIMAGFTEKKQALHDLLAGCLVLKG